MVLWGSSRLAAACMRGNTAWEEPDLEGDKLQVLPRGIASSCVHWEEGSSPISIALTATDPLSPCFASSVWSNGCSRKENSNAENDRWELSPCQHQFLQHLDSTLKLCTQNAASVIPRDYHAPWYSSERQYYKMHKHTIYPPTLQVSLAQRITGVLGGMLVLEAGSLLL